MANIGIFLVVLIEIAVVPSASLCFSTGAVPSSKYGLRQPSWTTRNQDLTSLSISSEDGGSPFGSRPAEDSDKESGSDINESRRRLLSPSAMAMFALGLPGLRGANAADMRNAAGLDVNMGKDKKPAPGSAAADLAVYQDDTLGYAFALPQRYQGKSQQIESGGQVLSFIDEKDASVRVTMIAQRTPIQSFDELEKAFVPNGKVIRSDVKVKDTERPDGAVFIYEFENDDNRYVTLFSLRLRSPADGGNWVVSLSCQAPKGDYAVHDAGFKAIINSYRPIYAESAEPDMDRMKADSEFGEPVGESTMPQVVIDMPWGGY